MKALLLHQLDVLVGASLLLLSSHTSYRVAAFSQQQHHRHSSSFASSSSSTSSTTRLASTTLQQSDRLTKAKQLLEEFSSNDPLLEVDSTPSPTNTAKLLSQSSSSSSTRRKFSPRKSSRNTSSSSSRILSQSTTTTTTTTTTSPVVPDSYWRNGHLQSSYSSSSSSIPYVTRWAAGVKVAEPLVKYDPVAAEQLLFRQPTKWLVRNVQIAWPVTWWVVTALSDWVWGRLDERQQRTRARQLTAVISALGPAIIKGGQALASRADLLPQPYLEELQKLQDDVPTFSNKVALQIVTQELQQPFEELFELVETEPIAAASIGQVYKARLKETGETVALKIQRPNCEEIIALDLYVLRWWAGVYKGIFQLLKRDINLQAVIDDFGELIYREIDYIAEMANAQRFNELYAGVRDVFVPKVYSELTTSKVLTMEWVDGFRLTDKVSLAKYNLDESKLVDTLVQCSLRQILENGFFHADPHAGNLLACPDGRLCYLDFGMMSYANSNQRNGFLLAVVHIVNRDWPELVRLYRRLGFIPEGTDLKPIEVALENALPDVLNADITELNFKTVVGKLGDIMYTYPFSLPPFYIAIIRCLGVLEGLAIQVDPKARIISEAYPYVASRVLTDSQPELQEALRRLALTSDGHVRWDRLEGLLDEAKESSGYDVTRALDMLTSYLISDDGDRLLKELSQQIVDATDSLGSESLQYFLEASRALAINDEVAAVRAFRSLQDIIQSQSEDSDQTNGFRKRVQDDLREVLPEPTPSMRRFSKILALLGAQGGQADPAKFVPIVRKLAQDARVQRVSNEILARLGERLLSRGLRAAFGLPPPMFGRASDITTVTEDRE